MLEIWALPQLLCVSLTTKATKRNCVMNGVETANIPAPSIVPVASKAIYDPESLSLHQRYSIFRKASAIAQSLSPTKWLHHVCISVTH
jgi:hypothetical protein